MSGLFGGGRTQATQAAILKGLRAQTSIYGNVIPFGYGRIRLAGNLIWYGDFIAIKHEAQGGKGGLFGGGGKGGGTQYTYQAAVEIAICQGPIINLFNVYDTVGQMTVNTATETYTVPGGGGTFSVAHIANWYDDLGVTRDDSYSVGPFTDYGSPGPVTLTGTQKTPMVLVSGAPAAGQYQMTTPGQYIFAAGDAGKFMRVTYHWATPVAGGSGAPITRAQLTLFLGTAGQSPWSYLTTKHPGQDLGYSTIAYVARANMDLGASGALPNLSFEITAGFPFGGGIVDANPKDVVFDILTNAVSGAGFPSAEMGDLTQYSNYCVANGLFISSLLDAERPAGDWVREILEMTNAEPFLSGGLLKIVPYGDTTVVGNGVTYSPQTAPVYDLMDDDFVHDSGADPVRILRPTIADVFNSIKLEFLNRANHYNMEIVEEKDQNSIEAFRARPADSRQAHFFTSPGAAQLAASTILKRLVYIRNGYEFAIDARYVLLEPMDLVTLTDSNLGYSKKPVRILQIQETDKGDFKVKAQDFPWGTAQPTTYPKQSGLPFVPDANSDPGDVNAPIIFEVPNRLLRFAGPKVFMGVSGASPAWGGCTVWMSPDGTTYKSVGKITAPARMGVLTSSLPNTADPDTTNTFGVDLTQSFGQLLSGTQVDCDKFRTLCWIAKNNSDTVGEFISYQTATLTSAYHYDIGTRLRRGLDGVTAQHSSGRPFLRVDDAVFEYDYDPSLVGTTLHFKFTSFNLYGMMEQLLTGATDYTIFLSGIGMGEPNPVDSMNSPASGMGLTQSGTSTTILMASGTVQFGSGTVAYNSASVNPGSLGTWSCYFDDPLKAGGSITLLATNVFSNVIAAPGRVYVGTITTVGGGGGSGGGGGGGSGGGGHIFK